MQSDLKHSLSGPVKHTLCINTHKQCCCLFVMRRMLHVCVKINLLMEVIHVFQWGGYRVVERLLASFQATLPLKEQEKVSEFTFCFDLWPHFLATPQREGTWRKAFPPPFCSPLPLWSGFLPQFFLPVGVLFALWNEHTLLWALTSTMRYGGSDWASFGGGQWRMEMILYNSLR